MKGLISQTQLKAPEAQPTAILVPKELSTRRSLIK